MTPPRQRNNDHDDPTPHPHRDRRRPDGEPVRLGPPRTVPINRQQYEQAVHALAVMIESWWRDRHTDQETPQPPGIMPEDAPQS